MTSKVESPREAAPEMESWPEISFSKTEYMICMDGRKETLDRNNPYHRDHWDVLMAIAEERLAPLGKPVLSTKLKSHLNQGRPPGLESLNIAASVKFWGRRIEKDPKNPTILLQGGNGIKSTVTLRARVVVLDAPDEQKEKEEKKEARSLIPYSNPPEIDLSFLGNGHKKEAREELVKSLNKIRDGLDVSLSVIVLSRLVSSIEGERVPLTKNAYEILNAVCPDVDEKLYSTVINKQIFLELITGHEEGPETAVYIVYALRKILEYYENHEENPRLLFEDQSTRIQKTYQI